MYKAEIFEDNGELCFLLPDELSKKLDIKGGEEIIFKVLSPKTFSIEIVRR